MTETQIWLIIAIVLFILEIISPGFVLANCGVAAIAAAGAAWFGPGREGAPATSVAIRPGPCG